MQIKPAATTALRTAMARLLASESQRTNGKLTWVNVFTEAGVPRATAARAKDIIAEWQEALQRRAEIGSPPVAAEEARALKLELTKRARTNAETVKELRDTIRIMANHIQALTLAVHERNHSIANMTTQLQQYGSKVVPIKGREA